VKHEMGRMLMKRVGKDAFEDLLRLWNCRRIEGSPDGLPSRLVCSHKRTATGNHSTTGQRQILVVPVVHIRR
jgi:hypothetical protein